jgi:hypothetical protein
MGAVVISAVILRRRASSNPLIEPAMSTSVTRMSAGVFIAM